AGHGEDAAGLVLQNDHCSLHHRPYAQVGTCGRLAASVGHAGQDHIVERELALRGRIVDRELQNTPVSEANTPSLALPCRSVSPARWRASSARHKVAAARSLARAARPAACRRSSCPRRSVERLGRGSPPRSETGRARCCARSAKAPLAAPPPPPAAIAG